MKNNLLIIGASGHARSVLDCVLSEGKFNKIGILVDEAIKEFCGFPVLGTLEDAPRFLEEYNNAVVAIGNNAFRLQYSKKLIKQGFQLPVLKHKTAYVSSLAVVGNGSVLLANSVVNANSTLGTACIVNTASTVDHDCILEDGVHLSPNSSLCGTVHVGETSWIGAGTTVIDHIKIGKYTIVGAGAVVVKDIPDHSLAYGVPARIIKGGIL